MNNTTKIIQDAIEGGFDKARGWRINPDVQSRFFLDPSFWQAVGKTRGWTVLVDSDLSWKWFLHQFIDHLAEGDDYETALSKLN